MPENPTRAWPATLLAIPLAAFALPAYSFVRWLVVFDGSRPQDDNVTRFLAGFPEAWRSTGGLAMASLLACALAALSATVLLPRLRRVPSLVARGLILAGLLVGGWIFFTTVL